MKGSDRKRLVKRMPMGVRIIGGWHYVGAVVILLSALLLIFVPDSLIVLALLSYIGNLNYIVAALLMIAFAAFYYYVGFELRIGKNWARTAAMTVAGIGIAISLYSMLLGNGSSGGIIVNLIIAGYLYFNKDAKAAFRKK